MRVRSLSRWAVLLLGTAAALAGCKPQASAPKDRVPPNPSAPARYGSPTGVASKEIPRALPPVRDANWQSAPFWVLHTELSPGILVHSKTRYLGLFADLAESGLGAPAHVAWSTKDGPRPFKPGTTHDAGGMEENWLLVWFAGATNWTNWDSPWAVFLQHKPTWLRLDERGLHLEFAAQAGDVVVMPLYGYFKLPPQGRDYLAEHALKSRQLFSWQWEKSLARDPLTRLRYWAGASREFPIYCEETFSVDRARDELTVRSRLEFHSIRDDWKTKPVKLAPVSPALALAARDKDFPARFSKPHFDMELPTPFGPYAGVQGADSFDVTFPWLHYVNETEAARAESSMAALPLPATQERGEGRGEGRANGQRTSSPRPSPPSNGGEGGADRQAEQHIAAAREAYRAGKMDDYHYDCLRTVQALTRVWAARRGADYFRARQPWDSMEWLEGRGFVSGYSRESGWWIDAQGSRKPGGATDADSVDVARFLRDWWLDSASSSSNQAVRAAARYERLIPPGELTPFVIGAEREVREARARLMVEVSAGVEKKPSYAWPSLSWPQWKSPRGDPWSFGRIKPVRDGQPASAQKKALNSNTEVVTYALP